MGQVAWKYLCLAVKSLAFNHNPLCGFERQGFGQVVASPHPTTNGPTSIGCGPGKENEVGGCGGAPGGSGTWGRPAGKSTR